MLQRVCNPIGRRLVNRLGIVRQCCYSTVPSQQHSRQQQQQTAAATDSVPDDVTVLSKPIHQRSAQRKPFVKSLFLGVVDQELLTFPESLDREEQARVEKDRTTISEMLATNETKPGASSIGLFGLQGPLAHGGRQFTETEYAYVSELLADDHGKALLALEHNAIVQLITRHGNDTVKDTLLRRLCSGELIGAAALFETACSRDTMFSTVAERDFASRKWLLNGSKVLLRHGTTPHLLAVVASTKTVEKMNAADNAMATFLVDARAPGVEISDVQIGLQGIELVTVHFRQVEVPEDSVIGSESGGTQVLTQFLSSVRVQSSVVQVTLLKRILNALTSFCINTQTTSGDIKDIEVVREQLARMACTIYAAESLIYMTTSLMDDFENQDVDVEAAITKIFSAEQLVQFATLPLKLLGPHAMASDSSFDALLSEALKLYVGIESLDSVKFFIALAGLQYAGMQTYEVIKKDRNPAMNPSHVLSKLFEKTSIANPKKFADLQQFFHPSLDPAAHWIEYSIVRLKLATECVLSRHGAEVIDRHVELARLANIATMIYAMIASASRASRSYCIGLRHADQEIHLANMFGMEMSEKVRLLALDLEKGPFITNDDNYNIVARNLFREKAYFYQHPITRNF
ncbi:complex I assembly factor ACAD9, mitochondrial [Anopheles aquasalis]|uniref:complex I assembly factor ACAD9, mitochondrial n=1 Tax=Anopheles aquasalis TaxID=42839 RepID=UPI00215B3D0D|nr:complex I assembly factor ACAD9, mitochondrial [Anopheles aquasalis]